MSSAIEVLKETKNNPELYIQINTFEDDSEISLECEDDLKRAIDEALLALEKQEKLNRWLEKEIETYSKVSNLIPNDYLSEQSLIIYKKVLNKLEGKA